MMGALTTGRVTRVTSFGALFVLAPALSYQHEQGPCTALALPGGAVYAPGDRVVLGPLQGSSEPVVFGRLTAAPGGGLSVVDGGGP